MTIEPEGMGSVESVLTIERTAQGKFSGTLDIMGEAVELEGIALQEDSGKLTFMAAVDGGGVELEFELAIEGDDISGTIAADGGTGTVSGKKQ